MIRAGPDDMCGRVLVDMSTAGTCATRADDGDRQYVFNVTSSVIDDHTNKARKVKYVHMYVMGMCPLQLHNTSASQH
jgi:hypothetical protein